MDLGYLFQGIGTMFVQAPQVVILRIALMLVGIFLVYLGAKNVLEPLIMVPMGIGMAAVNAGSLFLAAEKIGNLLVDPLVTKTDDLMNILQIDFLQPIYTFTFSNGLIACIVFLGIGAMVDIGFVLKHPFISMTIAMFSELGTVLTFPIAKLMGMTDGQAAAISLIGGADGPMVMFGALKMAPELFVPITVVAYLYLSLTYGGYPFLIRLMVPKHLRAKMIDPTKEKKATQNISTKAKLMFAVIINTILCLLFPSAAPLFLSFFLGIVIKECAIEKYTKLIDNVFLYTATLFLGLMLGVLCDANTILNPVVLKILLLGIVALLLSGVGGILGGYIIYLFKKGNFNPVIGIAGVSCVPTTAKVAQKEVVRENPLSFVMDYALGANICGVITTAILTGLYIALIR